jgi:hypothetical protein
VAEFSLYCVNIRVCMRPICLRELSIDATRENDAYEFASTNFSTMATRFSGNSSGTPTFLECHPTQTLE